MASRTQLLFEFDMQRESYDQGHGARQYFVPDAYPPSTRSIDELESIKFSDLQNEIHHRGKVLFIRFIDDEIRATAIQNLAEDETGAVERLALYNAHGATKSLDLLRKDAVFALKEPYYERAASGGSNLRVDHPSDLVFLGPSHPRIPESMQIPTEREKSALDWKTIGNEAYKANQYLAAARAYGIGIEKCGPDDTALKSDLLRNRAIVNTYLKRFSFALEDGKAAAESKDSEQNERAIGLRAKAHHRAGGAAYELGQYEKARDCFAKVQELTPNDEDAARELTRIDERLKEQGTGFYDFSKMANSSSKKHNRLDYASFLQNVVVHEAGPHGRGLFATKDLVASDLILCEKAIGVAFDSDDQALNYTILDSRTKRRLDGTQTDLVFRLVDKLLYDLHDANKLFELYDAGYAFKTPTAITDGLVPVDSFRVQAIVEYNSLGCPTVRSSSKAAHKQAASSTGYPSTGLWQTTSYINHACNGNAMRSFIGDMIVLRATRAIAKGDEILMPYRLPNVDNNATQEELQKIWGFKCDCELCTAEGKSFSQRRDRLRIIQEITTVVSSNPVSDQKKIGNKTVAKVEKLLTRLQGAYDDETFKEKPRLGLVAPGLWLCYVHISNTEWKKAVKAALDVLRDLGFIVKVSGKTVDIDRNSCHLIPEATEAAMYAAQAYNKLGETGVAKHLEKFASSLYEVLNAEARGFEDRYGKV